MVWPDGPGASAVALQRDPAAVRDLGAWVRRERGSNPDAVVVASFPGTAAGATNGSTGDFATDPLAVATAAATIADASTPDDAGPHAFTGDTTPTSLRSLRRWVAERVGGDGPTDAAALVVSELATNVERHSRSWVTVDVADVAGTTMIGVSDPDTESLPSPRHAAAQDVGGRGLLVVSRLSTRWGVVVAAHSKTVWALLAPDPAPVG